MSGRGRAIGDGRQWGSHDGHGDCHEERWAFGRNNVIADLRPSHVGHAGRRNAGRGYRPRLHSDGHWLLDHGRANSVGHALSVESQSRFHVVFAGWSGCDSDAAALVDLTGPVEGFSPDTCTIVVNGVPRDVTATYRWVGLVTLHAVAVPASFTSAVSVWVFDGFGISQVTSPATTETAGYRASGEVHVWDGALSPLGWEINSWTGCTPIAGFKNDCHFTDPSVSIIAHVGKVTASRLAYRTSGVSVARLTSDRGGVACGAVPGAPTNAACSGQWLRSPWLNPRDDARVTVRMSRGRIAGLIVGCTPFHFGSTLIDRFEFTCVRRTGVTTIAIAAVAVSPFTSLTIVRHGGVTGVQASARSAFCGECGSVTYRVPASGKSLTQNVDTGRIVDISVTSSVTYTGCNRVISSGPGTFPTCEVLMTANRLVSIVKK